MSNAPMDIITEVLAAHATLPPAESRDEWADAGACYIAAAVRESSGVHNGLYAVSGPHDGDDAWPWDEAMQCILSPRGKLVLAMALIMKEIESPQPFVGGRPSGARKEPEA